MTVSQKGGHGEVAFIGLGAMGGPMARNMVAAGFRVRGFDVSQAALDAFAAAGGETAVSPADAARAADLAIVMVARADDVDSVCFGPQGLTASLRENAVVVVCSTVPPTYIAALEARLRDHRLMMLDAPVSGGVPRAQSGELVVMAAGPGDAFAAAEKALQTFAKKVYRLGEKAGVGSIVKMINQLIVGVTVATTAEAIAFGIRAGADPHDLVDVISECSGSSWMFNSRAPRILAGDHHPYAALDIVLKDLGTVMAEAQKLRFPVPVTAAAHQVFLMGAAAGLGASADSGVVRIYEMLSGLKVSDAPPAAPAK